MSYLGFQKLGLEEHAPLIFASLVLITQLGVGLLHALGEDFVDLKGRNSQGFINGIWGWTLIAIYGFDIGSNALEFGVVEKFSSVIISPVEALGGSALIVAMSVMLAFGDEILMRLYDKISVSAKRNRAFAKHHQVAVRANDKYLQANEDRQLQSAEIQGRKQGDFTFGEGL